MTAWLYQMHNKSKNFWGNHNEYEETVREGIIVELLAGKVVSNTGSKPKTGDTLTLFFAWTGDLKGGICGWGEVINYDEDAGTISVEPRNPSDLLKLKPILNGAVKDITKRIRHHFYQGNMWEIPPDLFITIRQMIEPS